MIRNCCHLLNIFRFHLNDRQFDFDLEFRDATVAYNLESPTVPLDEVFFPSMVVCNMNTLRRSFIEAILSDDSMKSLGTSFNELKNIIFSVFILGGDYTPSKRDLEIIDSKFTWIVTLSSMERLSSMARMSPVVRYTMEVRLALLVKYSFVVRYKLLVSSTLTVKLALLAWLMYTVKSVMCQLL